MLNLLVLILATTTIKVAQCSTNKHNNNYLPITAFSIYVDGKYLNQNLRTDRLTIIRDLQVKASELGGCQVIGSISQISLKQSAELQFYFTYKLDVAKSSLLVNIFTRNSNNKLIPQKFVVVLDFLVARFPIDYYIQSFNMTSYQEHITYQTNRSYQLIFFLNGFNNFKLSGNVTHSYQAGADLYTIHYMSCAGQSNSMGWREGQDYLAFTVMVVPMDNLLQKFKVSNLTYAKEYPPGYRYFYGIKGSTEPQFMGYFQQKVQGVDFNVGHLGQNPTYGIIFLPYPQYHFVDSRIHKSDGLTKIIIFVIVVLTIFAILTFKILSKFRKQQSNELIEETSINSSQIQETPIQEKNVKKLKMNTVEQVDQKYQASLRGSYAPKEELEPQFQNIVQA